jgi:hypothetical protein
VHPTDDYDTVTARDIAEFLHDFADLRCTPRADDPAERAAFLDRKADLFTTAPSQAADSPFPHVSAMSLTVLAVSGSCTCLYWAERALTCGFFVVFDLRSRNPLTIRQVRSSRGVTERTLGGPGGRRSAEYMPIMS